jgi:hypothetical protein
MEERQYRTRVYCWALREEDWFCGLGWVYDYHGRVPECDSEDGPVSAGPEAVLLWCWFVMDLRVWAFVGGRIGVGKRVRGGTWWRFPITGNPVGPESPLTRDLYRVHSLSKKYPMMVKSRLAIKVVAMLYRLSRLIKAILLCTTLGSKFCEPSNNLEVFKVARANVLNVPPYSFQLFQVIFLGVNWLASRSSLLGWRAWRDRCQEWDARDNSNHIIYPVQNSGPPHFNSRLKLEVP